MPIHFRAEATCDRCGLTAPCELVLCPRGTYSIDSRDYWNVHAAFRGLATWFQKMDGMACSPACRDVLAKDPRYAGYSGDWTACP